MARTNISTRVRRCGFGRPRDQRGSSLIEVLIAVVLTGSVVLAIAGGLLTLVKTSADTSDSQRTQLLLNNFAESLQASDYVPCDTAAGMGPSTYMDALLAAEDGWTPPADAEASVDNVEYWSTDGASPGFVGECPTTGDASPVPDDQGTQRLSISVRWKHHVGRGQVVLAAPG